MSSPGTAIVPGSGRRRLGWLAVAISSVFANCDISGGGSQPQYVGNPGKSNIVVGFLRNNTNVKVLTTRLSNSGWWGIWKTSSSTVAATGNT
jgi:hypothetical protein